MSIFGADSLHTGHTLQHSIHSCLRRSRSGFHRNKNEFIKNVGLFESAP
jgi:hypothetical protein